MESNLFGETVVQDVNPVAPWIGGKRHLAKRLVRLIQATPHDTYAEPFVGMGGVFFRRKVLPSGEIINDFSGDVSNFFRILQRHYVPFVEMLRYQLTTRREFERLNKTDPSTLTDLERAARFLYLQRVCFGGKVAGRSFGVSPDRSARFDLTTILPQLEAVHERLSRVAIECLSFADFIPRYDRPETLFYCDPPYWGNEGDYGKDLFTRKDFTRLADAIRSIGGKAIISLNDNADVRKTFDGFHFRQEAVTYSIAEKESKEVQEVIITNFEVRDGVWC